MALVPWPTDTAAVTAAVAEITAATGLDSETAGRVGPVAAGLVQRYGAAAPESIED